MEPNDTNPDDTRPIAPVLFSIKKENPFQVPDNYFESLPSIIQERCIASQPVRKPWYTFLLKPKISLSLGFALVLLVAGINFTNLNNTTPTAPQPLSQTDQAGFEVEDIDENILVDMIASTPALPKQETENTPEEEYLIDHNIELSQLINEL